MFPGGSYASSLCQVVLGTQSLTSGRLRGKPKASRGNAVAPIYFGYHDIRDAQSEKGIYHTYLLQEIAIEDTIHTLDLDLSCRE